MKNIAIFYHAALMNKKWKPIVKDQVNKLKSVGLDKKAKLFCSLLGSNSDRDKFKKMYPMFEIIFEDTNFKNYEFPILNYIKKYSKKHDEYIFYFHSKGVSITPKNIAEYETNYDIIMENIEAWRKFLEYFTIENYKTCIHQLDFYDVVSANLSTFPYIHYAGNYWWTTTNYIKTLPPVDQAPFQKNDIRYRCEFWIGCNPKANLRNITGAKAGYFSKIQPEDYEMEDGEIL